MTQPVDRREFLAQSAAAGAAASVVLNAVPSRAAASANEKVVVAVMGLSRGRALAEGFARLDGVEVKYTCDVDLRRAESGAAAVEKAGGKKSEAITDFRRILDDKDVDALVCAAPNHWHAPATILGCAAGKHVYVEKPCSHNPNEGELMIQAARKHKRAVQMGSQRRSGDKFIELMQRLDEGLIGRAYAARCWYSNARGPVPEQTETTPPKDFNYELWQGPAPRMPFSNQYVHYNWHWFWHWGNGELGNNGVHNLDLCRWGLGVNYPITVSSIGGRYRFDDAQQTPDTHTVGFEFAEEKLITWGGLSNNRKGPGFVTFYGETGTVELNDRGYNVYDERGKEVEKVESGNSRGDREHLQNFVDAIRNDTPLALNAEIEKGHKSTLLCHLGNIAHRTGRTLHCDPSNGHVKNDKEAMALWAREYEPGWEPKV